MLPPLLESLGAPLQQKSPETGQRTVINGLSLGCDQLREVVNSANAPNALGIVRMDVDASLFAPGAAICLPTTVQTLRQFLAN